MSLTSVDEPERESSARYEIRLPPPMATYALIGANVAMFLLEQAWGDRHIGVTLFRMGANLGREALLVEPWRVLSSAFLHGSVPHVVMNMYALYVLGSSLERPLGWGRMLCVYALSALGGGLLSSLLHRELLSVGASGAVWGLMVADIVWMLRLQRRYGKQVLPGGLAQMARPLLINLAVSFLPGIDRFAHFGGGIMGAAMALLFPLQLPADDRKWRPWAVLAVVLMAAAVIMALLIGKPWQPLPPAYLIE
jgi:rhomboid protease GluP